MALSAPMQDMSNGPEGLKLKNTFLHVEYSFPEPLDDDCGMFRRQTSEPAPMLRQISSATTKLESLQEQDTEMSPQCSSEVPSSESQSSDNADQANIGSWMHQVAASPMQRQTSALSETPSDMISPCQAFDFDRQLSGSSTGGFCRQVTEEQWWPSYSSAGSQATTMDSLHDMIFKPKEAAAFSGNGDQVQQPHIVEDSTGSTPSIPDGNALDPYAAACAANAMASMMFAQSMWNSELLGAAQPTVPAAPKNYNRRKGRSLISQAQEAQRSQQAAWVQLQTQQRQLLMAQMTGQTPEQLKLVEKQLELQWKCMTNKQMMPDASKNRLKPQKIDLSEAVKSPKAAKGNLGVQPEAATKPKQDKVAATANKQGKAENQGKAATPLAQPQAAQAGAGKATDHRFCPDCGGKVMTNYKFCQFCGRDVKVLWQECRELAASPEN